MVDKQVTEWSRRVLYGTVGMSSIIFCGMYSAFLVSHRVAIKTIKPIENLAQLGDGLMAGRFRCVCRRCGRYQSTG
jgi:hypothetical protein